MEAEPEANATGGAGVEETGIEGLGPTGEVLGQVLQVLEQDMTATDEALSDLRGMRVLASKRKRGEQQAHQLVRHSLWEQDLLEARNEYTMSCFL